MTRYGQIEIANSEPFSQHLNEFGISPYLQEKLVFVGQSEVYEQAAELVTKLVGLSIHASQIYWLTNFYEGSRFTSKNAEWWLDPWII